MRAVLEKLRANLSPVGPPVELAEIEAAELAIGASFPAPLRTVWTEVGAGRLIGYPHRLMRPSAVAGMYGRDREVRGPEQDWDWPGGIVRMADFGCGIHACVGVGVASGEPRVWWLDPNLGDRKEPPWESPLRLDEWFDQFADGSTFVEYWP